MIKTKVKMLSYPPETQRRVKWLMQYKNVRSEMAMIEYCINALYEKNFINSNLIKTQNDTKISD